MYININVFHIIISIVYNYVIIEVHPNLYKKVRDAEMNNKSKAIILNSLYVPVLMQLLYELAKNRELVETHKWANIIVAKCTSKGLNIEDENAIPLNAQKLLEMPFSRLASTGFRT